MGGDLPEKRLGVRDGFRRYFDGSFELPVPVSVDAEPRVGAGEAPLPLEDGDILALARRRAAELATLHGERYGFCVGVEAGLATLGPRPTADEHAKPRQFVNCWAVVKGLGGEAWGSSGALQLPTALIDDIDTAELPFVVPGRRRSGGMVSSLTGGLETRRSAAALASFHALSSLMYSYLEGHSHRRRRRR